jgi:hypothetical protein
MMGYRNRNSCRNLFKILNIQRLKSQYIFSLLISVVNNKKYFAISADNLNTLTRQKNNLHLPQANLTIFKKGSYYSGIRTFSSLPTEMKDLSDNPNKYTVTLKHFFIHTLIVLRMNTLTDSMSLINNTVWSFKRVISTSMTRE